MRRSIKLSAQRIRHSFQVSILSEFFSLFQERQVYSGKGSIVLKVAFLGGISPSDAAVESPRGFTLSTAYQSRCLYTASVDAAVGRFCEFC